MRTFIMVANHLASSDESFPYLPPDINRYTGHMMLKQTKPNVSHDLAKALFANTPNAVHTLMFEQNRKDLYTN